MTDPFKDVVVFIANNPDTEFGIVRNTSDTIVVYAKQDSFIVKSIITLKDNDKINRAERLKDSLSTSIGRIVAELEVEKIQHIH